MSAKYIIAALAGSFAIAYASDVLVAQKKIFGGTTPRTVADKEWWQATDKKFQACPRTAGPPVVMNPISRQNFIVKDLKPRRGSCSDLWTGLNVALVAVVVL